METKLRGRGRPVGSTRFKYNVCENGQKTSIYKRWASMIARCRPSDKQHGKFYSERGIAVCARWQGRVGFDNFVDDMGIPLPSLKLTLGRIDNDKGYGPENCRWETWVEQAQNRRPTGPAIKPESLRQKSIKAGLPYSRVYQRITRLGWDEKKALVEPIQPRGRKIGSHW